MLRTGWKAICSADRAAWWLSGCYCGEVLRCTALTGTRRSTTCLAVTWARVLWLCRNFATMYWTWLVTACVTFRWAVGMCWWWSNVMNLSATVIRTGWSTTLVTMTRARIHGMVYRILTAIAWACYWTLWLLTTFCRAVWRWFRQNRFENRKNMKTSEVLSSKVA